MGDELYNLIVDAKQYIDENPNAPVDAHALIEALYWIQNGDWDDWDYWEAREHGDELAARAFPH